MPTPNDPGDIDFGGPAAYRIVVQGALSEDWSVRLAGLTIGCRRRGGAAPHTTLTGQICDQAQLAGVLETLYELHLPIVAVERLGGATGGGSEDGSPDRMEEIENET